MTTGSTLSPFRYPGGKSWLAPAIGDWVKSKPSRPKIFIEPFAGGANVGLLIASLNLADTVCLVEKDEDVSAVWKIILGGDYNALAKRILEFKMTRDNVSDVLNGECGSLEQIAFRTILRNRVNHGGVISKSGGMLKEGEKGRGVNSRWYPETLAKRIRNIAGFRDRVQIHQTDGLEIIKKYCGWTTAVFFIDPPYSAGEKQAANRLYNHHSIDHEKLFRLAKKIQGDFVMTYDDDEYIIRMAERYKFQYTRINMRNRHHAKMSELLIGRDISWLA